LTQPILDGLGWAGIALAILGIAVAAPSNRVALTLLAPADYATISRHDRYR
jgi:hypothetical protein